MAEQRIPSNPREYPRVIDIDGRKVTVADHYHHSAMAGAEYDANAQLVVREQAAPPKPKATPPKLETVLAAGYSEKAAKQIVAEEKLKFENDIEPYGNRPISDILNLLVELSSERSKPPETVMPLAQEIAGAEDAGDDEPTAEALFGKK
jgi:hypothetical protein